MNFPGITVGITTTLRHDVDESDTVGNHLPDDMEKLLSTPAMVRLMIEASTSLIDSRLPDEFISVGKSAEITHEHPTVVGQTLHVVVRVTDFDGYHITIEMEADDGMGICGRGRHVRSIVNKRWLQLKTARRLASL
jgi:predicted thioesterase